MVYYEPAGEFGIMHEHSIAAGSRDGMDTADRLLSMNEVDSATSITDGQITEDASLPPLLTTDDRLYQPHAIHSL